MSIVPVDGRGLSAIDRTREDTKAWRLREKRANAEREAAITAEHQPFCDQQVALLEVFKDWILQKHLREPHPMDRRTRFTLQGIPAEVEHRGICDHHFRLFESGEWAIWQVQCYTPWYENTHTQSEGEFWKLMRQLSPADMLYAAEHEFNRYGNPLP